MRAEYDFSKGARGKYAARYAAGTNVVLLDRDVAEVFPPLEAVNEALRALAILIQHHDARVCVACGVRALTSEISGLNECAMS